MNSEFYGVDKYPFFPHTIKPVNTSFIIGNITRGLPFKDDEFDLVFIRSLRLDLKEKDWDFVIKESLRITKPSGWIEVCELDHKFHGEPKISDILKRSE